LRRKDFDNLRTKRISLHLFAVLSLLALLAASASLTITKAKAAGVDSGDGIGRPYSVTRHIVKNGAQGANALAKGQSNLVDTIPFWSSVFTYNNNIYPYQMVGTDPSAGSKTTKVPTEIIPLNLTFSNGVTLDGTSKVKATVESPLFTKATYTSGKTQYGDAIQRAEFWKYVSKSSNKNYHVLLEQPKVYPTQNLIVPANVGQEAPGKRTGAPIGLISIDWFDTQLQAIMTQLHISPKTLPIFLDYNTFLYQGTTSNCCILGYHSALYTTDAVGKSVIQTYAFSAYSDPGIYGTLPIEDIHALSHEISEWYNDPLTDNVTPTWSVPGEPQYGCSGILEVGDPVVGIAFNVNGYHPEDEVFFSWFAKQVPSIGINGQYTYLGTYTAPSPTC
jgi:hypothetical protein